MMASAVFNVREAPFNATADDRTDNHEAFQKACDAAAAYPGATLYIPGRQARYLLNQPVWVANQHLRIVGDGPSTRVQTLQGPAFLLGLPRRPFHNGSPVDLPATARPRVDAQASPALLDDSVAVPTWGLRTTANEGVCFPDAPVRAGSVEARWLTQGQQQTLAVLTLDFIVQNLAGWKQQDFYPLFGLWCQDMAAGWLPGSYAVVIRGGTPYLELHLRTQDGQTHTAKIDQPLTADQACHRFSLEVDFAAGAITAFIDGQTVPVQHDLPAGQYLAEDHDRALFKLGSWGSCGGQFAEFARPVELLWAGFRVGHALRYQDQQGRQVRRDGQPLTDRTRCWDTDPATWSFHLPGQPAPGVPPSRLVWYNANGANGYGFFLSAAHADVVNTLEDLTLEGIHFLGGNAGSLVQVGQVTQLLVRDCQFSGGAVGLGSLLLGSAPLTTSYPVHVENCQFLLQRDTALRAQGWLGGHILGGRIRDYGRQALHLQGSTLRIADVFFSGCAALTARNVLRYRALGVGGLLQLQNLLMDFEGDYPTEAHLDVEAEPFTPGSQLTLEHGDLGSTGATQPLVRLRDSPFCKAAFCKLAGVRQGYQSGSTNRLAPPVDQSLGPKWTVQIETLLPH